MARFTANAMAALALLTGSVSSGCAGSPQEPSPREPIAAEDDCLRQARVAPPHAMAKRRGAVVSRASQGDRPAHGDSCPMRVPQTLLSAEVVDEGVALVFTTYGDVAELRRRVRELAYTHSHEGVATDSAGCGCPLVASDGLPLMAEASTSAQAVPRGAKLVLTPNERNELPRLRARVSERLEHLAASNCPLRDEVRPGDQTAGR